PLLLYLQLGQREQHHERQNYCSDYNLGKSDVRRLKDEKHQRHQQAVKCKADHLVEWVARKDNCCSYDADKQQNPCLKYDHGCSSALSTSGREFSPAVLASFGPRTSVASATHRPNWRMRAARAVAWVRTAF